MAYFEIDEDELETMAAYAADHDGPIVMVNLMRVRAAAEYPPEADAEPCSGSEALGRYSSGSAAVRRASGAEFLWRGEVMSLPIAPSDEAWDLVVLVRYPSAQAYLDMRATAEYQAARAHRRAGLADSRLYMTVES